LDFCYAGFLQEIPLLTELWRKAENSRTARRSCSATAKRQWLFHFLIIVLDSFGEVFKSSLGQAFQALRLGKQGIPQTTFDTARAYSTSKAGDRGRTSSNAYMAAANEPIILASAKMA